MQTKEPSFPYKNIYYFFSQLLPYFFFVLGRELKKGEEEIRLKKSRHKPYANFIFKTSLNLATLKCCILKVSSEIIYIPNYLLQLS